jgi:hypothetical protein
LKRNREIRNHLNIYCVNEKIEKKDNLLWTHLKNGWK